MSELEQAIERVRKALDLIKAMEVIEGTDRDDVERLLEDAVGNLYVVKKALSL